MAIQEPATNFLIGNPNPSLDYNTSPQIDKIAAAIVKAQPLIRGALKESTNPFFKSRYADLESVWAAVRKPFTDNDLAVVQLPVESKTGQGVSVVTILLHSSGQFISGKLTLYPKDSSPQGSGSAISYARRYALAAVAGVYQTDDDGNAASGREQNEYNQETEVDHKPAQATEVARPKEKKARKPRSSENEQENVESEQLEDLPTKEERIEYAKKLRAYNLDSAKLKAFITNETKVQNLNILTKAQFDSIILKLDLAQKSDKLAELIG